MDNLNLRLLRSTAFATTLAQVAEVGEARQVFGGDPLLKRSSDIEAMVPYWDTTDAIVEGYDAIRKAGKDYLPMFAEEKEKDYDVRLSLTKFTNVYRDILEGLASKPFEEEITLVESESSSKAPPEIEEFIEDVDGAGNNITVFSSLTFFNGINSAIDWIFVDYPTVAPGAVRSVADLKAAGLRPFWSHVLGRNVLEVRSKLIKGKQVLSYIRIFEPGITDKDRVRVFERHDDGRITWVLYIRNDGSGKNEFVIEKEGILAIDEIPLVPFVTGRRDGKSWKFFPAMRDAADLQIQLYQDESGLKFITTMAAYPMLAANGLLPELEADGKTPKKLAIGPMKVLYGTPDANGNHGTWSFIEPGAQSMTFLQARIDKTKEDLRELGRQPLTAQSGALTVITTAVAAGKAKSAVSAWTLNLKDTLENAIEITCKWMRITGYEPEVNVYNEFDNFTDGGADLAELGQARRNGDLSQETYWGELRRRKVLAPEFNAETERERLLEEIPGEPELDNEDDKDKIPPA